MIRSTEARKTQDNKLKISLDRDRSSFVPAWQDVNDYLLPLGLRLYTHDHNRLDRRSSKIIDSTATFALKTLRSGMMSGVTSPARPWFELTVPDPELGEFGAVKRWLYTVTDRMRTVFLRSNLYRILPTTYGFMGGFGTGCISVEPDIHSFLRFYDFPIGSYWIANNYDNRVGTFVREFPMTVRQLIQRFGQMNWDTGKPDWSNISDRVKQLWDQGHTEERIQITQVVRPNENYDPNKMESKFKRYYSCYYESGEKAVSYKDDLYLEEKGYDYFPLLCPRWELIGGDTYATSFPGIDALGDIRQLQYGEKKSNQAVEKQINPPMVGPTSLRGQPAAIVPGFITFSDNTRDQGGFRAAHETRFNIQDLEFKQGQVRQRIERCFYSDLFRMISNLDRRQITAREIDERREEKLLALGPVLEQLNDDLLNPLIEITFNMMVMANMIPPPPKEIQGMPLKVKYTSAMAEAQKLIGLAGLERFTGYATNLVQFFPEVAVKLNSHQMIDQYAEIVSLPPTIVRTDEEAEAIMQAQAQAQAAQQQNQMIREGAAAAKDLAQADLSGDNALNRLIQDARAGAGEPAIQE